MHHHVGVHGGLVDRWHGDLAVSGVLVALLVLALARRLAQRRGGRSPAAERAWVAVAATAFVTALGDASWWSAAGVAMVAAGSVGLGRPLRTRLGRWWPAVWGLGAAALIGVGTALAPHGHGGDQWLAGALASAAVLGAVLGGSRPPAALPRFAAGALVVGAALACWVAVPDTEAVVFVVGALVVLAVDGRAGRDRAGGWEGPLAAVIAAAGAGFVGRPAGTALVLVVAASATVPVLAGRRSGWALVALTVAALVAAGRTIGLADDATPALVGAVVTALTLLAAARALGARA